VTNNIYDLSLEFLKLQTKTTIQSSVFDLVFKFNSLLHCCVRFEMRMTVECSFEYRNVNLRNFVLVFMEVFNQIRSMYI